MTSSNEEKHWFRLSGDHAKQPLIKIIIRTWKWHMGFNTGLSWKSLETIKLALSLQSHTKRWWHLRRREVEAKSSIISTALYSGPAVSLCEVKHTLTLKLFLFHVSGDQKLIHLDTKNHISCLLWETEKKKGSILHDLFFNVKGIRSFPPEGHRCASSAPILTQISNSNVTSTLWQSS